MDQALFFNSFSKVPTGTNTRFLAISHSSDRNYVASAQEDEVEMVMPVGGTFKNLGVFFQGSGGGTATVTLRKNGSGTSMTTSASSSNTFDQDLVNTVSFSAGDYVTVQVDGSSMDNGIRIGCSIVAQLGIKESMMIGGDAPTADIIGGNNTSIYYPVFGKVGGQFTTLGDENQYGSVCPLKGTIKNFYVRLNKAPLAGQTQTYTVRKNYSDTSLAVTISATEFTGNNTTTEIDVLPGDILTILLTKAGGFPSTGTYVSYGFEFEPSINGQFPVFMMRHVHNSATDNYYYPINCLQSSGQVADDEDSIIYPVPDNMVMSRLYVDIDEAPGDGKSWTYTVRENSASTALTATISGASETTGKDTTNSFNSVRGDLLNIEVSPSGSPTPDTVEFRASATASLDEKPIIFHKR